MEGPATDPLLISEQPPVVDHLPRQEDIPPSLTQTPSVSDNTTNHNEKEPNQETIEAPRNNTNVITTQLAPAVEVSKTAKEEQSVPEFVKAVTLNDITNAKSTDEEHEQPLMMTASTTTTTSEIGQDTQPVPVPLTAETVPLVCVVCGTTLELVRRVFTKADTPTENDT